MNVLQSHGSKVHFIFILPRDVTQLLRKRYQHGVFGFPVYLPIASAYFYIVAHHFLRLVILAISLNLKATLLPFVLTIPLQDKIVAVLDRVP